MPASLFVQQVASYYQSITQRQPLQQTAFDVVVALQMQSNPESAIIASAALLLQRAEEYQVVTHGAMVTGVLYVHRFLRMTQTQLTSENAVPIITTALCIANKFTEDLPYDNATFSQLSGIQIPMLGQLELHFLAAVRFRLNVDMDSFTQLMDTFSSPIRPPLGSLQSAAPTATSPLVVSASAISSSHSQPQLQAQAQAQAQAQPRSRTPSTRAAASGKTPERWRRRSRLSSTLNPLDSLQDNE